MGFTRRKFLSMALKAGIAGAALPVLDYSEALGLGSAKGLNRCDVHVTGCMWCQCGCSMLAYVRDGKAVHVTGNPDDPLTRGRICIKPMGSIELMNSPLRLKTPLKRTGGTGDSAKLSEVSWEEALDEIAYRLSEIRKKHGGESLGIWASGRSAADGRYLSKAFAKLYGTRNWEKTGPFCNYSGKLGTATVTGTRNTPWTFTDDDFFAADTYVLIGSNLAATKPVYFFRIKERLRQGKCRLICIDPRVSETARHANVHIKIRPGTDLALALALARYLVDHNLVKESYLEEHAVGYGKYRKFLLQNDFSLQWAERVTGISANDISDLARTLAGEGNVIMLSNAGISHHANAVHTHRAFAMLAAMTGRYGKKANGFACLNNGAVKTGGLPLPESLIPKAREGLGKNPVMWLESLQNPHAPYKLRALISTGTPFVQWPDQTRLRRLAGALELGVGNEIVPNIGAKFFDFMLPAAFWIEAGGIAPVSDESRLVWCPKLVEPPGEAKPDRWWWIELGKRMGWEEVFEDRLKDPEVLQDTCAAPGGYSVRNFTSTRHNSLRAPVTVNNGTVEERGSLFLDGKFKTPSGKLEFWTESLEAKFREMGLPLFAGFYSDPLASPKDWDTIFPQERMIRSPFLKKKIMMFPVEQKPGKVDAEKFPLILTTGKPCEAIFGHTCHWVKTLSEFAPEQVCWIHPDCARKYKIKNGDMITVESPRGSCAARAFLTVDIRKDTVFIPSTFGKEYPFSRGGINSVNYLTGMDNRCPISGQIAFKGVRVNLQQQQTSAG